MLKAIPRYKCVQTFFIKVCCDTLLLPYLLLPTTQKYDSTVWHILNLDQSTLQELNFEIIPNDSFIFLDRGTLFYLWAITSTKLKASGKGFFEPLSL